MRRRAVHRRLGVAGAVIAAVIVLLNPTVVVWSVAHRAPGGPIELTALIAIGNLLVMAIFAILAGLAIYVSVWGTAAIIGSLVLSMAIANSPAGPAIVRWLE